MNTGKIQFQIDQLRKDKIIYAVEAVATTLICTLGYLFSNQYLNGILRDLVNTLLIFIAVGYSLYMGMGNFIRLKNIKKLEKLLK